MSHSALVAPIALRGVVIGALGIPDEEVALVEAIAARMALAAENLRLLDETHHRAARERLAREITVKMRRAVDMDTILQATVQELAKVLGTSRTFVQLGTDSPSRGSEGKRGA
jgi:GAF domain-containing protein